MASVVELDAKPVVTPGVAGDVEGVESPPCDGRAVLPLPAHALAFTSLDGTGAKPCALAIAVVDALATIGVGDVATRLKTAFAAAGDALVPPDEVASPWLCCAVPRLLVNVGMPERPAAADTDGQRPEDVPPTPATATEEPPCPLESTAV